VNPVDLKYPLVGLADTQPGRESWELFWDAEFFSTCSRREVADRTGMLIIDVEGRCWRISSVRDLGPTGGFWSRTFLFFTGDHRVDQALVPIPEMTFEDAKARLCAAIQNNPDHWRDDEAIAGEGGRPPVNEQDLLDEMKVQVIRSNSTLELVRNFWKEDPAFCLAKLEKIRARRRSRSRAAESRA
jgi:hypothetical protein